MTGSGATITVFAPDGVPQVAAGDDLATLVLAAHTPEDGDIVVLAQKIVSKAEGRLVPLDTVTPSPRAVELAAQCDKDPRLVELVLSETDTVMRVRKGVLIVRHRLGIVLANAGIDQSNIDHSRPAALLLPRDPDASAAVLRDALRAASGADVAVLIIDSLGRAWRNGTTGTAIGAAGLPALLDLRGTPDIYGRRLETSELGLADEIAAAASLAMGQAGEGRPLAIVRGVSYARREGNAAELVRPRALDLFP
ncbi:coenzyme F420-0:L-glutamate ligase [Sphingosinicella microcystinivorans]|uniref:coenzyme F420-0:L-glutamate ligase n=1 Tax=Sphingosinicella microcystinivorans TaxID=335406 RepID=UPI0022F40282|nr:coenzyme F420-0:L-glutamate ligase [Sphingosinicella microcystinivorans]WBX82800.1 coenzyme F420-0:L-glutamate ligase [Sphingosinicella microcystinivorans]